MNKDALDKVFSTFIRMRDRIPGTELVKCISCGKIVHWKESDAGHYVNRKHISTRWDERNVNAQCRSCNRFSEGNLPEYAFGLVKKYGKGICEKLVIQKMLTVKYSQFDINELVKHYKQKIKEL